jgi:uncharacterized membrane protein YdbT with pleckstrin-like domain
MKEVFKDILDKDEEIVKVFKPNKKRYLLVRGITTGFFLLIFISIFLLPALLAMTGAISMIDEASGIDDAPMMGVMFLVIAISLIVSAVFYCVWLFVSYSKTYYAYSNKRIIIRHGFIGVDFATLDLNMITTVLVNVGLLDKFIKPNTGTITFGSSASPVGFAISKGGIGFGFAGIDDAYVTYREIKEVIDAHKPNDGK